MNKLVKFAFLQILLLLTLVSYGQSPDRRTPPLVKLDPQIQTVVDRDAAVTSGEVLRKFLREFASIKYQASGGDVSHSIEEFQNSFKGTKYGRSLLSGARTELEKIERDGIKAARENLLILMEKSPELVSEGTLEKYIQDCSISKIRQLVKIEDFCRKAEQILDSRIKQKFFPGSRAQANYFQSGYLADKEFLGRKEDLILKQKKMCGETNIDLSSGFPPIRHQTNVGWCFAYAAADLLSYEMKADISSAAMAQTYYKDPKNIHEKKKRLILGSKDVKSGIHEGGHARVTLAGAMSDGVCLEKDLPSEFLSSVGNILGRANLGGAYNEIEYMSWKSSDLNQKEGREYCGAAYSRLGRQGFPNLNEKQFVDIVLASKAETVISQLSQKSCEGKRIPVPKNLSVSSREYEVENSTDLFQDLISSLYSGHPIAIEMNAYALLESRNSTFVSTTLNHAVIVAGKRWNKVTEECEFKIRNSWGEGQQEWFPASKIVPATRELTTLSRN